MKNLLLLISITVSVMLSINLQAQWCFFEDAPIDSILTKGMRSSSNGYYLSPSGKLRALVIYFEMVYADPSMDPSPNGTDQWPVGQLPTWKDELFDHAEPSGVAQGAVTRYFQEASSENHTLIGDYLVSPDNGGVFQLQTSNGNASLVTAINAVNDKLGSSFVTANGYNSINRF